MAVESSMVALGSPLPAFELPDLAGATVSSTAYAGRPLLVAFLCNHCPYVKHVEAGFGELVRAHPDVAVVGICTNDAAEYPDDAPAGLAEQAARAGWAFPYLVDESQQVGRAFAAACTPDFFLYDASGALAYRGAMDGSTPGNGVPVTGELLADAMTRVAAGQPVPEPHRPSMGCSIKWRA
ncbi:MAG: thioredoxin family protein [Nocardioides sp.]